MTQERMEKLWPMAISKDEKVKQLCRSILVNEDFRDYKKVHLNYLILDIEEIDPFYILIAELILNKENYDYEKLGLNIDRDDKGSMILNRDIYVVTDGAGRLIEDIIGPKLIKK